METNNREKVKGNKEIKPEGNSLTVAGPHPTANNGLRKPYLALTLATKRDIRIGNQHIMTLTTQS